MNQIITIKNIEYYLADDIYKMEPHSFIGCSKTSRDIIVKKKLKPEDYIYMKYIKSTNEWSQSNSIYRLAKVLITKDWVHSNLIMFKTNKTDIDIKLEALKAPPLLVLSDSEKFVDVNNNIIDIEIRGTKNINDIYFNVKDIGDKFILSNIDNTLRHPDSNFKLNIHYKLFKRVTREIITPNTNKKCQKELFLTFKGLTKLLYVSHSKNAEHFQDWANNILFTVQLGTKEEKTKLFDKILGCDANTAKNVINIGTNIISSIYLFTLGYVKDLRTSMNININYSDNDIVCKYGRTNDLSRRTSEHMLTFSKIDNIDIKLKCYSYIDNNYTNNAEADIKKYFKTLNMNMTYNNIEEIVVIDKDYLSIIEDLYQNIGRKYMGNVSEYIIQLKEKEQEIKNRDHIIQNNELKYKLEIQELKYNLEITILKKELELMKKYQ